MERGFTDVDGGRLYREVASAGPAVVLLGRRILDIALDNSHELTMDESGAERLEPPAIGRLHEIRVPTLVLPADHDPPDMARLCCILADEIPTARVVQIPETDHVVDMRQPEAFDRVVLAFLEEVG